MISLQEKNRLRRQLLIILRDDVPEIQRRHFVAKQRRGNHRKIVISRFVGGLYVEKVRHRVRTFSPLIRDEYVNYQVPGTSEVKRDSRGIVNQRDAEDKERREEVSSSILVCRIARTRRVQLLLQGRVVSKGTSRPAFTKGHASHLLSRGSTSSRQQLTRIRLWEEGEDKKGDI